jgi:hypothetical protein
LNPKRKKEKMFQKLRDKITGTRAVMHRFYRVAIAVQSVLPAAFDGTFIEDRLFLGSVRDACNRSHLKRLGVTHVVV